MFAKLFELLCLHIVQAAERAGWQPRKVPKPAQEKPKPRVRLEKWVPSKDNNYIGGFAVDADGATVATWWLVCEDSDIRPETWGHAIVDGGAGDTHGSEQEAINAMVAELSTWAEVDTGEASND